MRELRPRKAKTGVTNYYITSKPQSRKRNPEQKDNVQLNIDGKSVEKTEDVHHTISKPQSRKSILEQEDNAQFNIDGKSLEKIEGLHHTTSKPQSRKRSLEQDKVQLNIDGKCVEKIRVHHTTSKPQSRKRSLEQEDNAQFNIGGKFVEKTEGVGKVFENKTQITRQKKKKFKQSAGDTPFPDHPHPTSEECKVVEELLTSAHGPSVRPQTIEIDNSVSGCGEVPSVLDALMRTILSANTSNTNSARAFQGLINKFGLVERSQADPTLDDTGYVESKRSKNTGVGSVDWNAVRLAPRKDLYEAIKSGGLADMKSKNMKNILDQVWEEGVARIDKSDTENGELSLDFLHDLDNETARAKLVSYKGVGVKTAACVLLFCLKRETFAVDTHVFRMAKFLNWVPHNATRDTACFHLDYKIPNELKYSLHNLLIRHGRSCKHCRGGPERSPKRIVEMTEISVKKQRKTKIEKESVEITSVSVKKTKKIWVGNGMMKEIIVDVETGLDETDNESCVLEPLLNRVRKLRKK